MNEIQIGRGHAPLHPVSAGLKYSEKLERDGILPETEEYNRCLDFFFRRKTTKRCTGAGTARRGCGAMLLFYESGGTLCEKCWLAHETAELAPLAAHDLMARIGVPPTYQHCSFASWRGGVDEAIDSWASEPKGFLTLLGVQPGIGKTHLATAVLYSVSNANKKSCWWASAPVLAQQLADEGQQRDRDRETLRKSRGVGVLLIDDLGKEKDVVYGASALLQSLLDDRFRSGSPTIVTSNMTVAQLDAYDARTASRLGSGTCLELDGHDQRGLVPAG